MDKSYFSETEEDQAELLFYIVNNLFDVFNLIKLEQLSDIVDEKKIKALILEIEPLFENSAPLEITFGDVNFGIRYANMVSILNSLEKYLAKKNQNDRIKFVNKLNLKENIHVNELLKGDPKNVNLFAELFLLLSSVSSLKDLYIDRISEWEEKYLNGFLNIIEKYVILNEPEQIKTMTSGLARKYSVRTSLIFGFGDPGKTMAAFEKLTRKIEEVETEKSSLMKTINQQEQEIEDNLLNIASQSKTIKDMENKTMDIERELEMMKSSNDEIRKAHEDTYQEALRIDQFKKQINDKNLEIEKIYVEHKIQIRNYLDKISKLEETVLHFENKDEEYQSIIAENEKLKAKNKELYNIKEKLSDYEDLVKKTEKQTALSESLHSDKSSLQAQLEKINIELFQEKEKNYHNDLKVEGLNFEIEEMQNYIDSLKSSYDKRKIGGSFLKRAQSIFIPNMAREEESSNPKNLLEIDREQILREIEKTVEDRTVQLNNEIEELRIEKITYTKHLKEEINNLSEENQTLKAKVKEMKNEIAEFTASNSKLTIERDKIEISMERDQIEFKKTIYNLEKQRDNFENMNNSNINKLHEITRMKELMSKEFETMKENYNECSSHLELNLNEKKVLMDHNKKIQDEITLLKKKYEGDTSNLRKEMEKFKEKLKNKDLEINNKDNEIEKIMKTKNMNEIVSVNSNSNNITVNSSKRESKVSILGRNSTTSPPNVIDLNSLTFNANSNNVNKDPMNYNNSYPSNPTQNSIIIHTNNSDQLENALGKLGKEIESLKTSQVSKDELLKQSYDKIKLLETENKKLSSQIQQNLDKFNMEISQRAEDLEFLKRAYEEQKNKISREHDIISSSLYEMAFQFMSVKNEMNKKTSPTRKSATGNAAIRSKKFSLDK